jgi:hypothetical protein
VIGDAELFDIERQERQQQRHRHDRGEGAENADDHITFPGAGIQNGLAILCDIHHCISTTAKRRAQAAAVLGHRPEQTIEGECPAS